jgi:phospholipid transport system substrate-binding protein
MRKLFYNFTFFISLVIVSLANANTDSPKELVTKTVNEIIDTVQKNLGDDKIAERRVKLRNIINPRFDFAEMSKRSLGSHWSSITKSEQIEFVKVFSELLARTYLKRVETVKPGMVVVNSENVQEPIAIVKTSVSQKGQVFPLQYKLVKRSTGWKVYDVIIENIGLISNYRNEFDVTIRKEGFTNLLSKLKEKELTK